MKAFVNELGQPMRAIGQDGSMARMMEKYPVTLPKLIQRIHNSDAWSDVPDTCLERDLRFILEDNNVPHDDCPNLLTAARFYAKH